MTELQLILIIVTAGFALIFLTLCCVCVAISCKIKKNSFNVNISVKDLEKAGLLNHGVQYVYAPAPSTTSNEVVATVLEEDEDDEASNADTVVKKFPVIPKKTHTEKYNELSAEARRFYDEIMKVARELDKVSDKTTNTAELVKVGSNKVVVARIKNNKICLYFETMSKEYEEFMKVNFDKKAFTDKPLELKISNIDDKDKAKEVILIAYQRVLESRKLARKLAREKRNAKVE